MCHTARLILQMNTRPIWLSGMSGQIDNAADAPRCLIPKRRRTCPTAGNKRASLRSFEMECSASTARLVMLPRDERRGVSSNTALPPAASVQLGFVVGENVWTI